MWEITTLTEFAKESKSVQKFIFDRFCPFGQKPDKCQFCYQVWHPCKCLDKVKVILVFTHGANLRQMRHLPPLRHEAKLSKIKQMWHLQMVCSKFAIEVNPFFRPVFAGTSQRTVPTSRQLPNCGNKLLAEIRNIQSLTSFKRALKTYFFKFLVFICFLFYVINIFNIEFNRLTFLR